MKNGKRFARRVGVAHSGILLGFLCFVFSILTSFAAEITAKQAGMAIDNWLKSDAALGCKLGVSVSETKTLKTSDESASMHVVKLDGGGFIVTSADDELEPVIAFSSGDDLVIDKNNPLWVLLDGDVTARAKNAKSAAAKSVGAAKSVEDSAAKAKWNKLLAGSSAKAGLSSVSDVRVAPFVQSKWNQLTHNNYSNGQTCYNYYTPNNRYCGCVATAGSQMMRYHQFPMASVTAGTYSCAVDGTATNLTMKGGTYDWANMPLVPASGVTETQRQAIGKLTYDVGVSCLMRYASGGSAAPVYLLAKRFKDRFGYANAVGISNNAYSEGNVKNAMLSNFDAGYPVALGISDGTYGHAVVADGYGYSDATLYVHVNLGWGGSGDAWYNPPNIDDYTTITSIIYNVFPTNTGSVISGRVLDSSSNPVSGATVTAARNGTTYGTDTSDSKGIYAFIVPAGSTYTVVASKNDSSAGATVTATTCTTTTYTDDGYYYFDGAVGNNWGNDLTLSDLVSVSAPTFSPDDGTTFATTMNVSISCATSGAMIYYTLNGTTPTSASSVYTSPISLQATTTIKAFAAKSGMADSMVVTATYTQTGAPANDMFANAFTLTGSSGSVTATNTDCTKEIGEPVHGEYTGGASLWWNWTAPADGSYVFATTGSVSGVDTQLAIYTGSSVSALTLVASHDDVDGSDYRSLLQLNATAGTTYRIAVDIYLGTETTFVLTWDGGTVDEVSLDKTTHAVPVGGATRTVEVTSSGSWTAAKGSGASWLTINTASGSNGGSLSYTAATNSTGAMRTAMITVTCGTATATLDIFQASQFWYTDKTAAISAATAAGKRIFLESGRETSLNCNAFRHYSCEDASVKALLSAGYVLWFSDCDTQGSATSAYTSGLGNYTLPLVCIIDPADTSTYVVRTTGYQDESALYNWLKTNGVTVTTGLRVPYTWLDKYGLADNDDYETPAMADSDGDGFKAWEEYLTGTSPTNADDFLRCSIEMNGDMPMVTWAPTNAALSGVSYSVEGKTSIGDASWSATNSAHRFFRVKVRKD